MLNLFQDRFVRPAKWFREAAGRFSLIPLQFPLPPVRLLPIRKDPLSLMAHGPQHPDAGMEEGAATLGGHDQCLYGGLPVR
jgi:hypothetical protein